MNCSRVYHFRNDLLRCENVCFARNGLTEQKKYSTSEKSRADEKLRRCATIVTLLVVIKLLSLDALKLCPVTEGLEEREMKVVPCNVSGYGKHVSGGGLDITRVSVNVDRAIHTILSVDPYIVLVTVYLKNYRKFKNVTINARLRHWEKIGKNCTWNVHKRLKKFAYIDNIVTWKSVKQGKQSKVFVVDVTDYVRPMLFKRKQIHGVSELSSCFSGIRSLFSRSTVSRERSHLRRLSRSFSQDEDAVKYKNERVTLGFICT
ncbi:hypothetical protein D918_04425 [Trichuris suis]|nr:hypothetical protein D918_04425 [Trichuris suis]